MRRRGQHMNLVTSIFIYQDSLLFYDEIWCPQLARLACKNGNECSIHMFGLWTRTNQNESLCTKLYREKWSRDED